MAYIAQAGAVRGAFPVDAPLDIPFRLFGASAQSSKKKKEHGFLAGRMFSALAIFAALLASTTPSPLYPIYISEWGLAPSAGTTIFSVYAIGTLISLFLAGWLDSKTSDRRQVLLPALFLTMIGAVLFALADQVWVLMLGRFVSGVSTGLITGTASAAILDLETPGKRGRAATIATLAFTAGAASGPVLSSSALAMDFAPLVAPFLVIAVVAAIALIGLSLSPWRKNSTVVDTPVKDGTLRMVNLTDEGLQRRLFRLSCIAIAVSWMLGSMLMAIGVSLATGLFGLNIHALAGLTPAIFQLFAGLGQVLARRFWSLNAIVVGLVGLVLLQIATVIGALFGIPALFVISMPLLGVFYGFAFVGGASLVNESTPSGKNARRISNFYVVGYLSNAVPTFALGKVIDRFDISFGFVAFSVLMVAIAGIGIFAGLRSRSEIMSAI